MFRIKICGITNVEDAIAAVDAGADAIGLNFYEKSPRCVTVQQARGITDACVDRVNDLVDEGLRSNSFYSVGVFVNHSAEYICRTYDVARLAVAQLHGDEPATFLNHLLKVPAIRVHRLGQGGLRVVGDDLNACKQVAFANARIKVETPSALLLDAASGGQFGGTGLTLPWHELVDYPHWFGSTPLILAGGLTPDNVAEAIRIVRPAAVDVASGVESSPGKKDPHKVCDFVAAAKAAFESLES